MTASPNHAVLARVSRGTHNWQRLAGPLEAGHDEPEPEYESRH